MHLRGYCRSDALEKRTIIATRNRCCGRKSRRLDTVSGARLGQPPPIRPRGGERKSRHRHPVTGGRHMAEPREGAAKARDADRRQRDLALCGRQISGVQEHHHALVGWIRGLRRHEGESRVSARPGARTNIFCARWLPAGGCIVAARMQTRDAQVTTSF